MNCAKAMLSGRTLHCGWILLIDWALDGDKAPPPEYTERPLKNYTKDIIL